MNIQYSNQDFLNWRYARQIFGFEIWQFYVTYSAISSLIFGFTSLYLLKSYKILKGMKLFFILISILSLIILIMPLRKAAYVDLSIVNLIILFDLLGSLKFNILKRSQLISFFTPICNN